jgi:hypothetical protein
MIYHLHYLTCVQRILYEQTPNETTVYLGPWEVVGTDPPRVVWQCSYQGEVLEHFRTSSTKYLRGLPWLSVGAQAEILRSSN